MAAFITTITSAVDYSAVVTGIGVVMAAVALVYVAMKGGKLILAALR